MRPTAGHPEEPLEPLAIIEYVDRHKDQQGEQQSRGMVVALDPEIHMVWQDIEQGPRKDLMQVLYKAHISGGHVRGSKFKTFLRDSGACEATITLADEVVKTCAICHERDPPPIRPNVAVPLAKNSSEVAMMDLFFLDDGTMVLNVCDVFDKIRVAVHISNKKPITILHAFIIRFCCYYGWPRVVWTDLGREFDNELFRSFCAHFGIAARVAGGRAHWQVGIVERLNEELRETIEKTRRDHPDFSTSMILALAQLSDNSVADRYGYSSFQRRFGRNPRVPGILCQQDLAAIMPSFGPEADTMKEILSVIQSLRVNLVKAQSSEAVKRMLQSKIRYGKPHKLYLNQQVFYFSSIKARRGGGWEPGRVAGITDGLILVQNAGAYFRMPARYVKPRAVAREEVGGGLEGPQDVMQEQEELGQLVYDPDDPDAPNPDGELSDVEFEEAVEGVAEAEIPSPSAPPPGDFVQAIEWSLSAEEQAAQGLAFVTQRLESEWQYAIRDDLHGGSQSLDERLAFVTMKALRPGELSDNHPGLQQPKDKELDMFDKFEVYEWVADTGQRAIDTRWVNTQKPDGTLKSRMTLRGDKDHMKHMLIKDAPTANRIVIRVMLTVMASMGWAPKKLDVRTAFLQGGKITREVFVRPPAEVFARNPKMKGMLWKLLKTVYGLCDAPAAWHEKLVEVLEKLQARQSSVDQALYFWWSKNGKLESVKHPWKLEHQRRLRRAHKLAEAEYLEDAAATIKELQLEMQASMKRRVAEGWKLEGIMASHVDDLLYGGSELFHREVIKPLRDELVCDEEEEIDFIYTGLRMRYDKTTGNIFVGQRHYVEMLEYIPVEAKASDEEKMNTSMMELFRTGLGQLLWLVVNTRYDLAQIVSEISGGISQQTMKYVKLVNKAITMAKRHSELELCFQPLGPLEDLQVLTFGDSSWANRVDQKTQEGMLVFLSGKFPATKQRQTFRANSVGWASKGIKRVTRSTFSSELIAALDSVDEAISVATLLSEISTGMTSAELCHGILHFSDCMSLIKQLDSLSPQATEKRCLVDLFALREIVSELPVKSIFTNTHYQIADCLTKGGRQEDLVAVMKDGAIAIRECEEAGKKDAERNGFRLTAEEKDILHKLRAVMQQGRQMRQQ
jgi:hypothetical protein